jgi:AraC family transcriptional regulator
MQLSRRGLGKIANLHHGACIARIGLRTRLACPRCGLQLRPARSGVRRAARRRVHCCRHRRHVSLPLVSRHGGARAGALLLGNDGHCFECSHEHGVGDRCLSFRLTPAFLDMVAAGVPGARHVFFSAPRLPPHEGLLPVIAAAEAARDDGDAGALEELALSVAGAVTRLLNEGDSRAPAPGARDQRRIGAALRCIEARLDEPLSIAGLADVVAMSPYHFLRTFRALVGVTPHQFILHARMKRAAVLLRRTTDNVSAIAFAAGFGDLSTFNRRFARIFRSSPSAYRARAQYDRPSKTAALTSSSRRPPCRDRASRRR